VFFAISLGTTNILAQVSQVSVQALLCAEVHSSTLPAVVVLALGVVVQVSTDSQTFVVVLYL